MCYREAVVGVISRRGAADTQIGERKIGGSFRCVSATGPERTNDGIGPIIFHSVAAPVGDTFKVRPRTERVVRSSQHCNVLRLIGIERQEGLVEQLGLPLILISEPTRLGMTSHAVFCLKKKKKKKTKKQRFLLQQYH